MAELSLERQPASVSHSELTAGHDVTNLLSQINHNLKQSKADQILRLLQDHDKITDKVELVEDTADDLPDEYDLIREEKVICDSDTLTDSSSDSDNSDITKNTKIHEPVIPTNRDTSKGLIKTQPVNQNNNSNSNTMNHHSDNMNGQHDRETLRGYRRHRARTSVGFHKDMEVEEPEGFTKDTNFDTRDLSIRPKSSYVRRSAYRRRGDETTASVDTTTADDQTDSIPVRPSRSARPKSRLGRASIPRSERKIVMMEAEVTSNEPVTSVKDDSVKNGGSGNNNMYDRFSSTRQPKRESKRAKAFCDSVVATQQNSVENMSVDSYGNSMDLRDEVTEVQPMTNTVSNNVPVTVRNSHTSSFKTPTAAPRNSPVQTQNHIHAPQKRPSNMHVRHDHINSHSRQQEPSSSHPHHQQHVTAAADPHLVRSDSTASNNTLRSERPTNISPTSQIPLKRNNSNLTGSHAGHGSHGRPRNPEPVMSRPVERPDMRPNTRARRLHRRYMAPTQSHSVRPTSESVILARQKTEKNLMKKAAENRPHSEKIPMNSQNKNIDISLNPSQGPQTYITSKGGVTQASHVQAGGFRGYDPSSRQKSSKPSRDIPSDLTLPRGRHNSNLMSDRKPLAALMKLPPLEATLAAKKKERGLALAARETCV